MVVRWFVPKVPSLYSQKMKRLSCKIFGEYYYPPMPKEVAASNDIIRKKFWAAAHEQNEAVIRRQAQLPADLNTCWTMKYYPPHPQIRNLMYSLRQHGLYRSVVQPFSLMPSTRETSDCLLIHAPVCE